MDNKAQVQIAFNWIYIAIAGAVILLFFTGIVVKQKAVSEETLAVDIVQVMDSIFKGSSVSEKTKNFVSTSGLSGVTLEFDCNEGVGSYGIKGSSASVQNGIIPIFSPREIKTSKFITWSLPYNFPYKIMDLLIVTSTNTKYYLIESSGTFYNEFLESVYEEDDSNEDSKLPRFNVQPITLDEEFDPGLNFQVRLIGINQEFQGAVPATLAELEDSKVTAVSLQGNTVTYYKKQGGSWSLGDIINIVSMPNVDKDAAKYAAIFADDADLYTCNMHKVFKRLKFVDQVYAGKAKELQTYHDLQEEEVRECSAYFRDALTNGFNVRKTKIEDCLGTYFDDPNGCLDLVNLATLIYEKNDALYQQECVKIY
jgi:hypothetical protein